MVTGDISSLLSSLSVGTMQSVQGTRPPQPPDGGGDLATKIEEQLESEGVETLDNGKSVSEFIGELKEVIEQTEASFDEDADPQEVGEAVREAVSSLMEENGLDPEDFKPEPPPDGMPMQQGETQSSSGLMSQIGQQLTALFSSQSTDSTSSLLQAISNLPVGSGVDVTA